MARQTAAAPSLKRTVATSVFHYSPFLDRLNWMSRWAKSVKDNFPFPMFSNREEMYAYLNKSLMQDTAIDYFEFGVFEGESLRSWCGLNSNQDSRFFGFDSFQGLPCDWRKDRPKGCFSTDGKLPDIGDSRAEFVVGWFQKSLPKFLDRYQRRGALIINNDSDLYSSTLFCLTSMGNLILDGTVIIFDEFHDPMHEYRALFDFCDAFQRRFEIIAATPIFEQAAVQIFAQ